MANSSPKSLFSLSFTFSGKPRFRFVRSNFCLSKFYFKAKVLPIMPKFHLFFSQTQIFSLSPSLPFQPEPNLILMTAYIVIAELTLLGEQKIEVN